jgi:2-aminoadipate transaminase
VVADRDVLSLAGGLPATGTLPTDDVVDAVSRVVTRGAGALQYGPTEGEPELRRWIAQHELEGADPRDVVVTHGSQQALRLLVDALVDPGDTVVVERTSYVGMLQVLHPSGARLVDVGSDEHGMVTDELELLLASGLRPTLIYLAPTFQNPTGTVLSGERRRHLGRLAAQHGFVVVDDDPYRSLGFEEPPERLRDHVPADLAVTVGSFSKSIAPGLRVGWVHAPEWLTPALVRLKQSVDLHTGSLSQRLVLDLVERPGWCAARGARQRELHRARANALGASLDRHLGGIARCDAPRGGMFCWVRLDLLGADTDELLPLAIEHGVAVVPGSAFDPLGRPTPDARLCFATLDEAELDLAVARLGLAVEQLRTRRTAG